MKNLSLKITPTRDQPVLWIRRIVIIKQLDPYTDVREIKLTRGLNIIVGQEVTSTGEIKAFGHGVGKTSLCRLIRYCLGETQFGRKKVVAALRSDFPNGWVAAEIDVEGQTWAVLRPFAVGPHSRASQGMSIEELAKPLNSMRVPFEAFRTRRWKKSRILGLLPKERADYTWTPDETGSHSCRYLLAIKNVDWNPFGSGDRSGVTPVRQDCPRPKLDAIRLIRVPVFGLLADEEVQLQSTVDTFDKTLEALRESLELPRDRASVLDSTAWSAAPDRTWRARRAK